MQSVKLKSRVHTSQDHIMHDYSGYISDLCTISKQNHKSHECGHAHHGTRTTLCNQLIYPATSRLASSRKNGLVCSNQARRSTFSCSSRSSHQAEPVHDRPPYQHIASQTNTINDDSLRDFRITAKFQRRLYHNSTSTA